MTAAILDPNTMNSESLGPANKKGVGKQKNLESRKVYLSKF